MNKYSFDKKQGILEIKLSLYLEMDLDNKELEKLFNNLNIKINNNLVSDFKIKKVE